MWGAVVGGLAGAYFGPLGIPVGAVAVGVLYKVSVEIGKRDYSIDRRLKGIESEHYIFQNCPDIYITFFPNLSLQ
mgnify:CR=1 FL=1